MNRSTFVNNANSINVTVNGINTVVKVKEFSTGSHGWYMNAKLTLPIQPGTTKGNFAKTAKDLTVTIDGNTLTVKVKEFGTGSIGWYVNTKQDLTLKNGDKVTCQVGGSFTIQKSKEMGADASLGDKVALQIGLNITVVGSKEWAA